MFVCLLVCLPVVSGMVPCLKGWNGSPMKGMKVVPDMIYMFLFSYKKLFLPIRIFP